MCNLDKPKSWAKKTNGWHPEGPPPHFRPTTSFYSKRSAAADEADSGLEKAQGGP